MYNILLHKAACINVPKSVITIEKRQLFYWLDVIFNRVSKRRVKKYGADRVCSEWLLRNGASVKCKDYKEYLTNYNDLPDANVKLYIEEVDATEADIHNIGFYHFDGCKYITKVKLAHLKKVSDTGISLLPFLKDSLMHLEIIDCKGVTEASLYTLSDLQKLKILHVAQLPYIQKKEKVISDLQQKLPECKITAEL